MCLPCWNGWGNNMVTNIVFDPLVPLPYLVVGAGVFLAFLVLAAWRGLPGWWLRALAAAVVLVALVNPALQQENRTPLSDIVLLVVDQSASQAIAGRPRQVAKALAGLKARLGGLKNFEVRKIIVRDAPEGSDAGTLLMTALSAASADIARNRIAGAILVTDGQVHDMALAPMDFPAPVQILLTGRKDDWDRRLVVTNAPAFAIMGEAVSLGLRIEDRGRVPAGTPQTTTLGIRIDGGPEQTFQVGIGRDLTLPLKLAHAGQNVVQFRVPEANGELTTRNNAAVVAINGVRDRLRVLLVSGEPHAGERTWRNLLKSDSAVDLVHFTILRPPGKQDGVPVNELSLIAFPTRELFLDKIKDFDLIIFDRYRRRGILPDAYLENIATYVRNGGAVLVAAGPAFAGAESLYRSPLGRILPASPTAGVFETGFLPRVSKLGQRHPVTEGLEKFAPRPPAKDGAPGWGRWFRMVDLKQRSGMAVMTGPKDRPLLILDRVGKGRIALLASDQAWLWNRGFEGGGPQLELLRRLAHWMMKEPDLEEESLRARAKGKTITLTRRSMRDGARKVTITGPDGTAKTVAMENPAPGRYVYRFQGQENGLYRLEDASGPDRKKAVIALGPSAPKEFEDAVSTGDILAPLSRQTRGGIHRLSDGLPDIRLVRSGRVATGRGWIGLAPRNAYVTSDIRLRPLGRAWIFLLLSAGLMLLAWRREGR